MAWLSLLALYRRRARRWQPYFSPLDFKVGWGHRPAVVTVTMSPCCALDKGRVRCNSKVWEGRPQDLLPHFTVPCSHPAPGNLSSFTRVVWYQVALLFCIRRSEVMWGIYEVGASHCSSILGWLVCHDQNRNDFQSSMISVRNFQEIKKVSQ